MNCWENWTFIHSSKGLHQTETGHDSNCWNLHFIYKRHDHNRHLEYISVQLNLDSNHSRASFFFVKMNQKWLCWDRDTSSLIYTLYSFVAEVDCRQASEAYASYSYRVLPLLCVDEADTEIHGVPEIKIQMPLTLNPEPWTWQMAFAFQSRESFSCLAGSFPRYLYFIIFWKQAKTQTSYTS